MLVSKQTTSMSVLARVTVGRHANMYQIVLLVMIHVTVVMLAILCKILPFMTDHVVAMMVIVVQICNIPPSEKDRATEAAAVVNML